MIKIDAVIQMHRSGDHVGAISGYRRLLRQHPANARLHGLLGLALVDSGQLEPAEAEFHRALRLDSGQVDALEGLAIVLRQRGRLAEAVALLEAAIARQPAHAWFSSALAQIQEQDGRPADALATALDGLRRTPSSPVLWGLAARLAHAQHGPADALQLLSSKPGEVPVGLETLMLIGVCHRALGQFDEARRAFGTILAQDPRNPQARLGLAEICHQLGDYDEAEKHAARGLADHPRSAAALNLLALVYAAQRRFGEARDNVESALACSPDDPDILNNAGGICLLQGQPEQALGYLQRAVALRPSNVSALTNLGNALRALGDLRGALTVYEQAIVQDAGTPRPGYERLARHLETAIVDGSLGKNSEEVVSLPRQLVRLSVIVCSNRPARQKAIAAHYHDLFEGQDWELILIEDARSICEGYARGFARSSGPIIIFSHDDIEILNRRMPVIVVDALREHDLLGVAGTDRLCDASWRKAEWPHNHGAVIHVDDGQYGVTLYGDTSPLQGGLQAIDGCWFACRREVVEVLGFDAETFDGFHGYDVDFSFRAWQGGFSVAVASGLALVHESMGNFGADWREYAGRFVRKHRALLSAPPKRITQFNPSVRLATREACRVFIREWVGSRPLPDRGDGRGVAPEAHHRNRWSYLMYDDVTGDQLHAQQREFNDCFGAPWRRFPIQRRRPRDPERALTVGFVSGDLREHPVGRFIEPLFRFRDDQCYRYVVYNMAPHGDAVTERLQSMVDVWHHAATWTDATLAERVVTDQVDVLIDLSGHTMGQRPQMLARRPAPVQASFLGYPGATDLEATEVLIADAHTEPERPDDGPELALMSGSYFCFTPDPAAPPVMPPPMLTAGIPTFGFFGSLAKITASSIALWSAVLREVPTARMVLRARAITQDAVHAPLQAMFERHGIDVRRIEWRDWVPYGEYLRSFGEVDLLLDSSPFNLATNTCDALWMGVPVLTLVGRRHASRLGRSVLMAADMPECIANALDEYCAIAKAFVAEPAAAAGRRAEQRDRLRRSELLDGAGYARRFEQTLRELWRRKCEAGETPSSKPAVMPMGEVPPAGASVGDRPAIANPKQERADVPVRAQGEDAAGANHAVDTSNADGIGGSGSGPHLGPAGGVAPLQAEPLSITPAGAGLAIYTVVTRSHLPRARVLMKSVRRFHPDSARYVVVVDQLHGGVGDESGSFEVIGAEDLDLPGLRKFSFRYGPHEMSCAVKPWGAARLLNHVGHRQVIYLDSDVQLYGPLLALEAGLADGATIVLTPHLTAPLEFDGCIPSEVDILRAGWINAGIFALRAAPEARRFLSWWCRRLEFGCIKDLERGWFWDQKWLDLTPGMFDHLCVLRRPGYNAAYWNLTERKLTRDDSGALLANGQPLACFHFSGFDLRFPEQISRHQTRFRPEDLDSVVRDLLRDYAAALLAETAAEEPVAYQFDHFHDGTPITDEIRGQYRANARIRALSGDDPFARPEAFGIRARQGP